MSVCEDAINDYLDHLTDGLLCEKSPPRRPIVGEPRHFINLVVNVRKANFVFEAHTGAGKTTFGLTLYHKAKLGEIPGYDVVVVRAGYIRDVISGDGGRLLKVIFDHDSEEHKRSSKYVYSTSTLNIECRSLYECIVEYSRGGKKLIVVLDELEQAYEWAQATETLVRWFSETRRFNDERGAVPLKLVVLLPKVLKVRELERTLGRNVAVFTEFRELKVDESILENYVLELGKHVSQAFLSLLHYREFRRLLKVLGELQSGRWIFPYLRRAIAKSVCEAINNQLQGDVGQVLRSLSVPLPMVKVEEVLDRFIIGIAEGRPFRVYSKSDAIRVWSQGFAELYKRYLGTGEILTPSRVGYRDFIANIGRSTLLWLTLRKNVDKSAALEVLSKRLMGLEVPERRLKVLVLYPSSSSTDAERTLIVEKPVAREPRRRVTIEVNLRYRALSPEELMAIATLGGFVGLDINIAERVVGELVDDIKHLAAST